MRFLLVGDGRPAASRWPPNAVFYHVTLLDALKRIRSALGVAPAGGLGVAGGSSKISDFKPMLAHLFPDMLDGCHFWGYMQEDQLLGDLRAFFDDDLLSRYDVFSPLPEPYHHAGPFMLYRRAPHVDALYRRSSQWREVARDPEYMVFDEWWGPRMSDHMPAVVSREARRGRLRAYAADPPSDRKVWMQDDFMYAEVAASNRSADGDGTAPRAGRGRGSRHGGGRTDMHRATADGSERVAAVAGERGALRRAAHAPTARLASNRPSARRRTSHDTTRRLEAEMAAAAQRAVGAVPATAVGQSQMARSPSRWPARAGGRSGGAQRGPSRRASVPVRGARPGASLTSEEDAWGDRRWYDETLLLSWRRGPDGVGRMWAGAGTAVTTQLWHGRQGQRAILHLMGSKHRPPFAQLLATPQFLHVAASTDAFHVTTRGLYLAPPSAANARDRGGHATGSRYGSDRAVGAISKNGSYWYSGLFPGASVRVPPQTLRAFLARLEAIPDTPVAGRGEHSTSSGEPDAAGTSRPKQSMRHDDASASTATAAVASLAHQLMPCVAEVRLEGAGGRSTNVTHAVSAARASCDECVQVQRTAAAAAAQYVARACAEEGIGNATWLWVPFIFGCGQQRATRSASGGNHPPVGGRSCRPLLAQSIEWAAVAAHGGKCIARARHLAYDRLRLQALPAPADGSESQSWTQLPSLLSPWALGHGLRLCNQVPLSARNGFKRVREARQDALPGSVRNGASTARPRRSTATKLPRAGSALQQPQQQRSVRSAHSHSDGQPRRSATKPRAWHQSDRVLP